MPDTLLPIRRFAITNEGCQPHLFDQVHAALEEWAWLVPPWVDAIRLRCDSDDQGTLNVVVSEEYRTVYLHICNGWGTVPECERGRWVMHELLHIHTNHLSAVFQDLLKATTSEDSALRAWGEEQMRRADERATNDLERALWERHA